MEYHTLCNYWRYSSFSVSLLPPRTPGVEINKTEDSSSSYVIYIREVEDDDEIVIFHENQTSYIGS